MSLSIKSQVELLRLLSCCKDKYRKAILLKGDKPLIQAICECIYNIIQGNVKLDSKNKEILYKYRKQLRNLCKQSSLKDKKKILVQKGGFLKFLLPNIISSLPHIFT